MSPEKFKAFEDMRLISLLTALKNETKRKIFLWVIKYYKLYKKNEIISLNFKNDKNKICIS